MRSENIARAKPNIENLKSFDLQLNAEDLKTLLHNASSNWATKKETVTKEDSALHHFPMF